MKKCAKKKNEPNTARIVIVTSYSTFSQRHSAEERKAVFYNKNAPPWQYDALVWDLKQKQPNVDYDGDETDETDEDTEPVLGAAEPTASSQQNGASDSVGYYFDDKTGRVMRRRSSGKTEDVSATVSRKDIQVISLHLSHTKIMFERVLGDEAHLLRNEAGRFHRMFRLIPCRYIGLATATPTRNRITDIHGFVSLLFYHAQLHVRPPRAFILGEKDNAPTRDGDRSWFTAKTAPHIVDGLMRFQEMGWDWHLVNPIYSARIVDTLTPDAISQQLFKATGVFTVRRGMDTPCRLPNGVITFPKESIPPHRIYSEILKFGTRHDVMVEETDLLLRDIKIDIIHDEDQDQDNDAAAASKGENSVGKGFALTFVRALTMAAIDYYSWQMLLTSDTIRDMDPIDLEEVVLSHVTLNDKALVKKTKRANQKRRT